MLNIILMGMAGSGKGTQAQLLGRRFGLKPLSSGDLLREEINSGSELGKKVKSVIERGDLVDDEDIISVYQKQLEIKDAKGFVLDGFPRRISQAEKLETLMAELHCSISAVIMINVAVDELVKRIAARFMCKNCGAIYNSLYKSIGGGGVCSVCGKTEFISRKDDSDGNAVKRRLEIFQEESLPIIEFYQRKNLIYSVDGLGSIEEVENRILQVLKNINIIN